MSDLVTGEAVVLGLRTAKLPSRALALLLDLAVEVLAFFVTVLLLVTFLTELDGAAVAAIMLSTTVFFLVAVPILVETLTRGKSLGKLAFGLRVVRADGGPTSFRHALVRGLVGFFEIIMLVGAPAAITSLISPEGRRLGDIFAGTLVVRERVSTPGGSAPLVSPPPQVMYALGSDLVRLDLSAVPDGLWLAIRQLLSRNGQLDGAVAFGMAERLAGDVAQRTRWAVPPGLHPAVYLGAVLTERQRREWARATAAPGNAPPWAAMPAPAPVTPPPLTPPAQPVAPVQPTWPPNPPNPTNPTSPPSPPTAGGFTLPG